MTRSQRCEPGWTPEEMAARQDADPDIGPIMEAGLERPAPLGGHLAGITRGQGAMAPVGTVIPGRRSTAPTVPRVGGTGKAAQVGCPGGSTRQSSPAVPWRDDQSPSGHGTHPGAGGTGFLLTRNTPDVRSATNATAQC